MHPPNGELAEDPPAIEEIYVHKYFQNFIYFIWIDRTIWAATKISEQYFIE